MEDPQQARPQVVEPVVGIEQLALTAQRERHRVDGEIPPGEVLGDRGGPNLGERARRRVALGPGLRDVDLHVALLQPPGEEEARLAPG